ncbi:MAG: 2-oxo acid dehydrogenase subunit E2, partial [Candidatus Binatia bacterium]
MSIALTIPEVGESISEVSINEWLKKEGDSVEQDENLVIIETDKATVEIPAPQSGRLSKILKRSGDTATVAEVIGYIDTDTGGNHNDAEKSVATSAQEKPSMAKGAAEDLSDERNDQSLNARPDERSAEALPTTEPQAEAAPAHDASTEESRDPTTPENHAPESEPSRQIARQKSPPTPRSDAERSQKSPQPVEFNKPRKTAKAAEGLPQDNKTPLRELRNIPGDDNRRREEVAVPMSQLRRRIAERLVHAQQSGALLTTFNEIDMSAVVELREKYRDAFLQKYAVKLGFMSFFIRAAVEALKLVPEVNAEIRNDQIVYHNFYDLGVAVGGGKGLVVPIIRDAERLSFAEIETAIADFAQRAKESKLKPDELRGGTFTITNGGIYGSLLSTPIINPPQSAILGLHAIQERPVVRAGSVVVRSMMYVALT